ncbi:MAG TPA: hypothetical protein VJ879_00345, partial [Desulfobacter sp.]|nr:hypothetical protein [Desulfobacter sp.]
MPLLRALEKATGFGGKAVARPAGSRMAHDIVSNGQVALTLQPHAVILLIYETTEAHTAGYCRPH